MSNGDVLYAWQIEQPDGAWGIIAAILPWNPDLGPMSFVMRDANLAATVTDLAKAHGEAQGRAVRLGKFRLEEAHPE
jgi:hypothetical protein